MEDHMRRLAKAAGFAGILIATIANVAPAAQLNAAVPERQPVMTQLSVNASAMTFWVIEPDGWRVVTIVDTVIGRDSDAERHAVARFSSVLLPGQWQLISVPLPLGEQQRLLRVSRVGDRIQVERIPGAGGQGLVLSRNPRSWLRQVCFTRNLGYAFFNG
jgi:hypothetical protein